MTQTLMNGYRRSGPLNALEWIGPNMVRVWMITINGMTNIAMTRSKRWTAGAYLIQATPAH